MFLLSPHSLTAGEGQAMTPCTQVQVTRLLFLGLTGYRSHLFSSFGLVFIFIFIDLRYFVSTVWSVLLLHLGVTRGRDREGWCVRARGRGGGTRPWNSLIFLSVY